MFPLIIVSAWLSGVDDMARGHLHCRDKEEGCLGITQRLPKLRPLPSIVRGDRLILSHPLNGDFLLSLVEPSRVGLIIWHQEET